jgi:glutamate dehydrogenase
MHPLLAIERDVDGGIAQVGKSAVDSAREAYLYAEIPLVKDAARCAGIEAELRHVFNQLRDAVADHRRMVEALQKHMAGIELCAALIRGGTERAHKLTSFLQWLSEDNYIFLGYRYDHVRCEDGVWQVELDRTSVLGLLRDTERALFRKALSGEQVPAPVRSRLENDRLVFFDKSRSESTIHRKGRLDCVSIKVLDQDGQVEGFGRFIGLLTHNAIRGRGSAIPILSKRLERVLEAVGAQPSSHTYKAAVEAFDSLPVEFLFPFDLDDVIRAVQHIIRAAENPQVDVYVVPDPLNRSFFVSVILPRPLYDEELRGDLHKLLTDRYGASYVDNRTSFLDDEIALIHFFCTSSEDVRIDTLAELERDIKDRATGWENRFEAALLERHSTERAYQLAEEYGSAFPEEYRVVTKACDAVRDVENLERLRQGESQVELDLRSRVEEDPGGTPWIKIYQKERPYLTDLLPVLDNFGLQVIDATLTQVSCGSAAPLWIVTFRMEPLPASGASSDDVETLLLDGLRSVLWGRAENDHLNRLILCAGIGWPEVRLVRAYLTYARQLGGASGRRLAAEALLKYPAATFRAGSLGRPRLGREGGALRTCEGARVHPHRRRRSRLWSARKPRAEHHADELLRRAPGSAGAGGVQDRPEMRQGDALAQALRRDLRALCRDERRSSARRTHREGGHPLGRSYPGPALGDSGTDEDPDGEERFDCAGWSEGRLCSEAPLPGRSRRAEGGRPAVRSLYEDDPGDHG